MVLAGGSGGDGGVREEGVTQVLAKSAAEGVGQQALCSSLAPSLSWLVDVVGH